MRLVSLVAVASVALWSSPTDAHSEAPSAKARSGKRVRVERPRFSDPTKPRFCMAMGPSGKLTCIGAIRPAAGETVVGFDGQGGLAAEVVVAEAEPSRIQACRQGRLWDITYRVARQGAGGEVSFGFTGLAFDATNATLQLQPQVSPEGLRPNEDVFVGLDAGSDGSFEHLVTARPCNDMVPPGTAVGGRSNCVTHWTSRNGTWRIAVEDVVVDCQ